MLKTTKKQFGFNVDFDSVFICESCYEQQSSEIENAHLFFFIKKVDVGHYLVPPIVRTNVALYFGSMCEAIKKANNF